MREFVQAITGTTKAPKIKIPTPAKEPPATPMPDPEDLRRAAMATELKKKRTGRASTILADEEDGL